MAQSMATLNNAKRKDTNHLRLENTIELAQEVARVLGDRSEVPVKLLERVETAVKRPLHTILPMVLSGKTSAIDSLGSTIWNAATNLIRHEHSPPRSSRQVDIDRLVVSLRVFAFQLLDYAYSASSKRSKDPSQRARNFKIGLKACRCCLERNELEHGLKILERCSEHVGSVDKGSPLVRLTNGHEDSNNESEALDLLVCEFHLLRVMHAWKSKRMDIATLFSDKVDLDKMRTSSLAEKAADLYYEIAKSSLQSKQTEDAVQWLWKALTALDACDLEHQSDDAADLRLAICSRLVDCLLTLGRPGDRQSAERLIQRLTEDHALSSRLAVQIMQANILLSADKVALDRVSDVLQRIVRSSLLTEESFKLIMRAIHMTNRRAVELACNALTMLIRTRILPECTDSTNATPADYDRLEKACVTLTLFATSAQQPLKSALMAQLRDLLEDVHRNTGNPLSAKAVHAMQTLIWKTANGPDPCSEAWLSLLRRPIFDGAGQVNKARIGRKAMMMAMERGDLDAAREAFYSLPHAVQNEPLTQYLNFKLALLSNDCNAACASLDAIAKHTRDDGRYLYACVLEAQQCNVRHVAVAAFEALLDKQPPGIHLPTLLRCTARMLVAEFEETRPEYPGAMAEEVVQVFERAKGNIKALKQASGDRWRAEIQWWSKNAYNLALRMCSTVHPELLFRLLVTCTTFIDHYPNDSGIMHEDDLRRRKMLCHFLAASTMIVLARAGDQGEQHQLQSYINCRLQVESFKALYDARQTDKDLAHRMFEVLKYDVECVLKLKQWDEMNAALQACLDFNSSARWDTLADLVLIIHRQSSTIGMDGNNAQLTALIQRIINETWKKDKDLVKVSRWLRLSFSIDLSDADGAFALQLLQQAADMAKKGQSSNDAECYPETELQWLATTAFNHAIDLLSGGAFEDAKIWIDGALEVARYAADEGALHANLTHKKGVAMARMESARPRV